MVTSIFASPYKRVASFPKSIYYFGSKRYVLRSKIAPFDAKWGGQAEGASELAGALSFNDHSRLTKLFMHKNPLGEDGVRELQKFLEDCPKVLSGFSIAEHLLRRNV